MEQYLLIRRMPTERSEPTLGIRGGAGIYAAETQTLDDQEAAELASEDDVDLLTRAMPLKLIVPVVSASSESDSCAGSATWGIKATGADQSEYDGSGVIVAVLDTGIDRDHECFEGVQLLERDFTGAGVYDTDGHGTHCAGTIFGRSKSGPRIGVAPGVSKALIGKVIGGVDGGSTATLKQGIDWAIDNGASVISMSLGFDFPGYVAGLVAKKDLPIEFATSVALTDYRSTIRFFDCFSDLICVNANAPLIVAAAGNESRRPQFPIEVAPPAAANHVLSVAAIREKSRGYAVAEFSNTSALLAAPGVNVLSARAGGGYLAMDGTSMATPHVAGVAALWAQYLGEFGHDELRSRVHGTARRFGLNRSDVGAGVVQAPIPVNS